MKSRPSWNAKLLVDIAAIYKVSLGVGRLAQKKAPLSRARISRLLIATRKRTRD
jgi:hypothetical protein